MHSQARRKIWDYLGPVAAVLLVVTLVLTLWEPVTSWLEGAERYDREAMQEWIQEARIGQSLSELIDGYLHAVEQFCTAARSLPVAERSDQLDLARRAVLNRRQELHVFLRSLGDPLSKIYKGQLPLFPVMYQLRVTFSDKLTQALLGDSAEAKLSDPRREFLTLALSPIVWDSEMPRRPGQYQELPRPLPIHPRGVLVQMQYNMHVYASQQYQERQEAARQLRLSGLATIFIGLIMAWIYLAQWRERERQEQLNKAERLRLQEELLRQEAERRQQDAEHANLELKSQLWANIGIMAGSYAHNIKNLLVRPNDLLNRCLEVNGLKKDQGQMLQEVRQTLGTVTERLQQILQTVRRDPTHAQRVRLDLNLLLADLQRTWADMARDKWKLTLTLEPAPEPLWIEGDLSHLQQAFENLLFNARDATFEKRTHLRQQARSRPGGGDADETAAQERRQALIAAASWEGAVRLHTYRQDTYAVAEVCDNGIGMTEEVRRRCTEAHFTTKRNNALFAGMSAGMGLGLSFIQVILEHHRASLSIEAAPLQGAIFRIRFPLSTTAAPTAAPAQAGLAENGQDR